MEALIPLLLVSVSASAGAESLREALRRRSDAGSAYAGDYEHEYEPYMFAAIPLHPPMPVLHVLSPGPVGKRALRHISEHRLTYASPSYTRTFYGSSDFTKPSYASDYGFTSFGQPDFLHSFSEYRRPSYQEFQRPTFTQTDYAKLSFAEPNYLRPAFLERPPEVPYGRPSFQLSSAEIEYPQQAFPSATAHVKAGPPSAGQESASSVLYAKPTAHGGYSYRKAPTKKRTATKKVPKNKESPVIIRVHKYKTIRS